MQTSPDQVQVAEPKRFSWTGTEPRNYTFCARLGYGLNISEYISRAYVYRYPDNIICRDDPGLTKSDGLRTIHTEPTPDLIDSLLINITEF